MKLFEELKWRGLIKDISSDNLKDKLDNEKIAFYWGTDPTADSLHLGHYSSLVMAMRLAKYGHHPILLMGGATGLIGDPRPSSERDIIKKDELNKNLIGIKNQVEKVFKGNVTVVNNYDWMKEYNYLEFLRDIGKYINVNYMLDKDIINRRLETGITYAEFSYTLIQGYDFLHLFREKNCLLQVAGSDQWGNITTGIELIRKIDSKEAYGFTMPLVVDKYGKKFGKSEGNALWLDINKTSSYELYQYLINVDDEVVIDYLKIFTFLTKEQIESLEASNTANPHLREAHKTLACEIITDLHGKEEYEKALLVSEKLFSGDISSLSLKELMIGLKDVPNFNFESGMTLIDLLVKNEVASSKREAREFLSSNSISINGKIVNDEFMIIDDIFLLENKAIIIRKGKKKYYIGLKNN